MSNSTSCECERDRAARRGAIRTGAIVVVLLCACIALIGMLVRSGLVAEAPHSVPAPAVRASGDATSAPATSPMVSDDASDTRSIDALSIAARAPSSPDAASLNFDGRGVIRGHIEARNGSKFPEAWTLIVEPSPLLVGRERAIAREVKFTRGEQEFTVADLPFAGYRVRAQAPGLNNHPADVLLVKGSAHQFVDIAFLPSGSLDGIVLEHSGSPAEGMDVTLVPASDGERAATAREVRTDAAGHYVFEDVLDGDYHLIIGTAASPLLAPDFLSFRAPSLHFPSRTLPPTCHVNLTTKDEAGLPLGEARVSGFAHGGSAIDAQSDAGGKLAIRYLLPGKYRFTARVTDGRQGTAAVVLDADKTWDVQIRLKN